MAEHLRRLGRGRSASGDVPGEQRHRTENDDTPNGQRVERIDAEEETAGHPGHHQRSAHPNEQADCLQTHGSLANWHPHLHLVLTDGGFRPDADPATWERLRGTIELPAGTRYVVVEIFAFEDVLDDATAPEFDGHFADEVTFGIRVTP